MQYLTPARLFVIVSFVMLCASLPHAAHAAGVVGAGTPASCTEAALTTALVGGGHVTFNCGGPALIVLTGEQAITTATLLDGGDQITLSGGNTTRLFSVGGSVSLTLRNITLTNGYANADGGAISSDGTLIVEHSTIRDSTTDPAHSGGAIVSTGLVTITNSTLAGNSAGSGGAIYPRFAAARTTIINSILRDNWTTNTTNGWGGAILLWDGARVEIVGGEISNNTALAGGAIYNPFANSSITLRGGAQVDQNKATGFGGGIYNTDGTITLTNVFLTNDAADQGGGIYNLNGTATLTNVTLADNSARTGGGIYNTGGVTLTNVTVRGNQATFTSGGGIYNSGHITLTNATVSGNSAVTGGGLYNTDGSAMLTNVTLVGNAALTGGGLYNADGPVTLTNVTLSDNSANNGGGINNAGTAMLANVTLAGNSATFFGGGIYNTNTAMLTSVTLAGNSGPGGGAIANGNSQQIHLDLKNVAIADSLSGGNCSGKTPDSAVFSLSSDTTCILNGVGNHSNTPALLGALQNNGGDMLTQLPRPNSPLINGGQCGADVPATDQRGVARPQGAACDIGAVELRAGEAQFHGYLPLIVR